MTKYQKSRILPYSVIIVILIIILALCWKGTWILGISFYQKYISPRKGYSCAYAYLHNDVSCSQYGKQVIARGGVFEGLIFLNERFKQCGVAAKEVALKKPCQSSEDESCCCVSWTKPFWPGCCCFEACPTLFYGKAYEDSLYVQDSIKAVQDSINAELCEPFVKSYNDCTEGMKGCGKNIKGCGTGHVDPPPWPPVPIPPGGN